jgi:nicotinamide/nicotinate riboside kinase
MLVVGLSGASCSGKTTIGNILQRIFKNSSVFNQDLYYWPDGSEHHIKDPESGFVNWELISAFNMNSLVSDLTAATSSRKCVNTTEGDLSLTEHRNQIPDSKPWTRERLFQDPGSMHPTVDPALYQGLRLVLVEGITVLNDPRIAALCDHRIFIELDHDTCWDRRRHRTYDPEDQIGYFESIMWPGYVNNLDELKSAELPIFYLDGKDSVQDNACRILNHILDNSKSGDYN